MLLFCDRLSLGACVKLVWLRFSASFKGRTRNIQVLDPIARNAWQRLLIGVIRLMGFTVQEARFFEAHLEIPTGESVSLAAVRLSSERALSAAEQIVENSSFLSELNSAWGRNTVSLNIARDIWQSLRHTTTRVLVASVLARQAGVERAVILIDRPHDFDVAFVSNLVTNLDIHFTRQSLELSRNGRFFLVFWLLRQQTMSWGWKLQALLLRLLGRSVPSKVVSSDQPSVLLIQEAEVSLDRSYRTQPHWFFENEGRLPFRTYIIEDRFIADFTEDSGELSDQGIQLVSRKELTQAKFRGPSLPIGKQLRRGLRGCILRSILGGSGPSISSAISIGRLMFTANLMISFCRQANVKAFLTLANYYREVDAIQLIAPALGIRTLSYQSSNLPFSVPSILTNADTMLVFSSKCRNLWNHNTIHPESFVDIGYPYDTSFDLVRQRAATYRLKLEAAGARFIICYFDENATKEKYGEISYEDNQRDLMALMQLVLDDPTVGLVIKTKLQRFSPRLIPEISSIWESVEATGRAIELGFGPRRNLVFPAEAALCADLTIGHAVGSTAVLEGATVGTRGILLNPLGAISANNELYDQADIVYPSLEAALDAIRGLRTGTPERQNLGDWAGIIDEFDPFRDGRAGHRIRSLLEEAVMTPSVPA